MNIDNLKKKIKSSPKLECIYMTFKAMKNEELAKQMVGTKRNPDSLIVNHFGTKNPNKYIYCVVLDDDARFNGFCSLYRMTLMYLAYAENMMMTPVVYWGANTLYYDESISAKNVFDYYFRPVSKVDYSEALKSKFVINSKPADAGVYGTTGGYSVPEEEIQQLALYVNKYIFLKEEVKQKFWKELENITDGGKTLGVHVRATDFNKGYNRHPVVVTPAEYLEETKKEMQNKLYEKVFLATDDNSVIDLFKNEFGEKLYYYENTFRSTTGEAIHYGNQSTQRKHHKYQLGLEIIKDFYTLGFCSGLIAGNSNVSMCSRIIKESTGESYLSLNIIDKGTYHNMRETRNKFNSMLKSLGNKSSN